MTGASGKNRVRDPKIDVKEPNRETYRTVAANPGPPSGRGVYHPEMFLHAVGTSGRFGNQMSGRRLGSLDLDKAFCTYRLVATPRVVDVRGVILSLPRNPETNTRSAVAQSGMR